MASTKPFLPIAQSFNGTALAGSNQVTRWTYPVPAGKRAQLRHAFALIQSNTAAAGTLEAYVQATIGGITIRIVEKSTAGLTNPDSGFEGTVIDLDAGDTVQGVTFNGSAVAVTMRVDASITEYQ